MKRSPASLEEVKPLNDDEWNKLSENSRKTHQLIALLLESDVHGELFPASSCGIGDLLCDAHTWSSYVSDMVIRLSALDSIDRKKLIDLKEVTP